MSVLSDDEKQKIEKIKLNIEYLFALLDVCYRIMIDKLGKVQFSSDRAYKNKMVCESYQLFVNALYSVLSPEYKTHYNSAFSCITLAHHARVLIEHITLLKLLLDKEDKEVSEYIFLRNAIFEFNRLQDLSNHKERNEEFIIPENLRSQLKPYFNNKKRPVKEKLDKDIFEGKVVDDDLIQEHLSVFHPLGEKFTTDRERKEAKWSWKILHEAVHGAIYLVMGNTKLSDDGSVEYVDSFRILETVHISLYYIFISFMSYCEFLKSICCPNIFDDFFSELTEKLNEIKG